VTGTAFTAARFDSTRWSMVAAAQSRDTPDGEAALAELCSRYWRPLFSYVRRCGYSTEDAQDLTQAWFARLLDKNFLVQADAERGKFRSFLLASLKHFLANEWDRSKTVKRGGGVEFFSIDDMGDLPLAAAALNPEQVYERACAIVLLDRSTARLASEFAAAGKGELFEALKAFLSGDQGTHHRDIAASLQMSEGAVRVAVHRMRDRFRAIVRTEIAQTVANPADAEAIDEELRYLLTVL
jgi:DNA-directed RNA polymerase specialized sigma24 family protein